jgi:hypothetical protein
MHGLLCSEIVFLPLRLEVVGWFLALFFFRERSEYFWYGGNSEEQKVPKERHGLLHFFSVESASSAAGYQTRDPNLIPIPRNPQARVLFRP